uniref:Proheparin-binding EGF-like growth factor n=1 Tax=Cyprinus carpio TaxID=7962 RepID=A0A8C1S342_CYPCA
DGCLSTKPRTTMVILFHTLEKTNTTGHQVDRGTNVYEKYDYDEDYDLSGDYDSNQPRVAFSTKPKHPSAIPTTEKKTKKGKRKGKGKGKGRKKNPCLEKYKDFCIHGVCEYLEQLDMPTCRCIEGYDGERCHINPVFLKNYSKILCVILLPFSVVLSLMCLAVIAILLELRYHKKDAPDVESAEVIREER